MQSRVLSPDAVPARGPLDGRATGLAVLGRSTASDTGEAHWTRPAGGYFISLDLRPGCARKTVELARHAGIALTPAGAPFPGGYDPNDRNIRISPSYSDLDTLDQASAGIALCAQVAASRLAEPEPL